MSKTKKKRTKPYQGTDAADTPPIIHRIEAVDRGRFGQWYYERRKLLRRSAIVGGVSVLVIWLIIEVFQIIF